ncbi:MAG: tryptophan synthase subunit alpha, partial [Methylophilaceae bacterium]|nr:tryptophan synthase subunit alpha [Methylophilaceae bacterium]
AIRRLTALPIGVGFGIGDANTAKAAAEIADAVVIGSRLVQVIAEATTMDNLSHSVRAFMQTIRVAVDSVTKLRSGHELAE